MKVWIRWAGSDVAFGAYKRGELKNYTFHDQRARFSAGDIAFVVFGPVDDPEAGNILAWERVKKASGHEWTTEVVEVFDRKIDGRDMRKLPQWRTLRGPRHIDSSGQLENAREIPPEALGPLLQLIRNVGEQVPPELVGAIPAGDNKVERTDEELSVTSPVGGAGSRGNTLSGEQLDLLRALAAAQRAVPVGDHKDFMTATSFEGIVVILADGRTNRPVDTSDLVELANRGLVRITGHRDHGDFNGHVADEGFALLDNDETLSLSALERSSDGVKHEQQRRPHAPDPYAEVLANGVDVAIVTVLPEEYQSVLRLMEGPRHVPGSDLAPNKYAWEIGVITTQAGDKAYSVALALAARPGNTTGALATIATAERWKPRYVMLVGIAGGLGDLQQGDVVISSVIWSYEYGKIDNGFHPRPDFTYQVSGSLLAAAQRLIGRSQWRALAVGLRPPEQINALAGPVGSGDKVVDNINDAFFRKVLAVWPKVKAVEMEGAGAAAAIDQLKESSIVGFVMIRGISDLPRDLSWSGRFKDWLLPATGSLQTKERDQWKSTASSSAAAFAVSLIADGWPVEPRYQSLPRTPVNAGPRAPTSSTSPPAAPHQRSSVGPRGWSAQLGLAVLAVGAVLVAWQLFVPNRVQRNEVQATAMPGTADIAAWSTANCPSGTQARQTFSQTARVERIRLWSCINPATDRVEGPVAAWYDSGKKALEQRDGGNGEHEQVEYFQDGHIQMRGRYRDKKPIGWQLYYDEMGRFDKAMCYAGNTRPWVTVKSESEQERTDCPEAPDGPADSKGAAGAARRAQAIVEGDGLRVAGITDDGEHVLYFGDLRPSRDDVGGKSGTLFHFSGKEARAVVVAEDVGVTTVQRAGGASFFFVSSARREPVLQFVDLVAAKPRIVASNIEPQSFSFSPLRQFVTIVDTAGTRWLFAVGSPEPARVLGTGVLQGGWRSTAYSPDEHCRLWTDAHMEGYRGTLHVGCGEDEHNDDVLGNRISADVVQYSRFSTDNRYLATYSELDTSA